jgi:hypothetical protein
MSPVGLSGAASLDPAIDANLNQELADILEEWAVAPGEAHLAVHILGRNYPLMHADMLRQLLEDKWIRPETPVLHQQQGKWYEASKFPGIAGNAEFDPESTIQLDVKSPHTQTPEQAAVENRARLAAKLGREAEDAVAVGDIGRAIAIYEEIAQVNPRYPLIQRRLRELRAMLERETLEPHVYQPSVEVCLDAELEEDEVLTTSDLVEIEELPDDALIDDEFDEFEDEEEAPPTIVLSPQVETFLPPKRDRRDFGRNPTRKTTHPTESAQSVAVVARGSREPLVYDDTAHEIAIPAIVEKQEPSSIESSIENALDELLSSADLPKVPTNIVDGLTFSHDTSRIDWAELTRLFEKNGFTNRTERALETAFCESQFVCFVYFDVELIGAARAVSDGIHTGVIVDLVLSPRFPQELISTALVGELLQAIQVPQIVLMADTKHHVALRSLGFLSDQSLLLQVEAD